jgi:asparagine synthase (glutamine-hydrolysing)
VIKVHLREDHGKRWTRLGGADVSGYVFWEGQLLTGASLAAWFADAAEHDLPSVVRTANGSFQGIYRTGDRLLATVDRVRSMPIFYASVGDTLIVSDDAYWVAEEAGDQQFDRISLDEFRAAGYVTGGATLSRHVRQIQAGEILDTAIDRQGHPAVTVSDYYKYTHHDDVVETDDDFEGRLGEVIDRVGGRLVESLAGETALVPLSGGLDSRLVALILRAQQYDDVICFSYGRPENAESQTSRSVAKHLGYRWVFAPYDNEMWRRLMHSPERLTLDRYADNLASLPHLQDWPAVRMLRQAKKLPDRGIFVPGHTGDFLSGQQMAGIEHLVTRGDRETLARAIRLAHYPDGVPRRSRPSIEAKILAEVGGVVDGTRRSVLAAVDTWNWRERQAKYIVNSVRSYEFIGHGWRLPLWDNELMDFWERVPIGRGPERYEGYVARQGRPFGLPSARTLNHVVARRRLRDGLRRLNADRIARRLKSLGGYANDPLAFFGSVPPRQMWVYAHRTTPHLAYHADLRLAEITADN